MIAQLPMLHATIRISVLGSLSILKEGQVVHLRRKDRALLAYLAITNRAHQRASLVELLCREADHPAAALRLLLSRIKAALGADILSTTGKDIALHTAICQVDLIAFEHLIATDTNHGRTEDLVEASNLYRGSLLDGLVLDDAPEFDFWLLGERARVHAQYLRILQELLSRAEQQTAWELAIHYARRLVEANPLGEEAHFALINLYNRTGQNDAARAQREYCRQLFRREFVSEPSVSFPSYQEQMIGLAPTPPLAVQPVHSLLERSEELQHLVEQWVRAQQGRRAFVLLEGEAGVGKSRLLREFLRTIPASSLHLLACSELTYTMPYAPWVEVLESSLNSADIAALPPIWRDYLLRLLPGFTARSGGEEANIPPIEGRELDRLFTAVAHILTTVKQPPLIIAIEDIHWADDVSLHLLGYLSRHLADRSILFIATLRLDEEVERPALQMVRDGLARDGALRLTLAPLSEAAIAELTARSWRVVSEADCKNFAARVARATGGNALFVTEILREVSAQAILPIDLPIPPSARELLHRRLVYLSAHQRQVIEALAILETPATFDQLCEISAQWAEDTATALDFGLRWGILTTVPEAPLRYVFSHDLLREAVIVLLSTARKQIIHRRIAHARDRAAANIPHGARLALAEYMVYHTISGDDSALLLRWAPLAIEQSTRLYAYTNALRIVELALQTYDRLVEQGEAHSYIRLAIQLRLQKIVLLNLLDRPLNDLKGSLTLVEEYLAQFPDPPLLAFFAYCQAILFADTLRYEEAIQAAEQAYQRYLALGATSDAAACRIVAAIDYIATSRNHVGYELSEQALRLYRQVHDLDGESISRVYLALATLYLGRVQEVIDQMEELLALPMTRESPLREAHICSQLAAAWSFFFNPAQVRRYVQRVIELHQRIDIPALACWASFFLALAEEQDDNHAEAERLYQETWQQAQQVNEHSLLAWVAQVIGRRAYFRGDVASAAEWLERSAAIRNGSTDIANMLSDLTWQARLLVASGDPVNAVQKTTQVITTIAHFHGEFYPIQAPDMYLAHAEALAANDDRVAAAVYASLALAELERFGEQIRDPEARAIYTASSFAHRIRSTASQWLA
jgi:predicted ATPase/DNA-binding SARP family transcriptional activator